MIYPSDYGLPDKFESYHQAQIEAIQMALESPARFIGMALPTGVGKSLVAMTIAKAIAGSGKSGNVPILTATKALQSQYIKDFQGSLEIIYGKSNYTCLSYTNCRFGALSNCPDIKAGTCTYALAKDQALSSPIYTANYAWWIRGNERMNEAQTIPADIAKALILDEGDAAFEELSRSVQVEIRESWLLSAGIQGVEPNEDLTYWRQLATYLLPPLKSRLSEMIAEYKRRSTPSLRSRLYEVEELINGLGRVQYYSNKNWVCELFEGTEYGRVWKFDCIWPGYLAESKLWLKIQKIFVMSASLRPFDLKTLLNVPSDQLEFREWPRQFRAQDTPVYAVPARRPDGQKIRIVYHTQEDDLQLWVKRIDEIIEPRLGRKGIIHTVSFARQQYLVTHSRFARHFLVNRSRSESESAAAIADKYIHSEPPSILVSPSFDTGWDFPGDHCRWQIISKIAFPETKSKLMSRRKELSANYINSIAMRNLIQSSGRGSRSKLDWCEVFVVDGSASGFFYRNRNLAPRWFNLIEMNTVPKPMRSR